MVRQSTGRHESSSPSAGPTESASTEPLLTAAEYENARRDLRISDTGRFELLVIRPEDGPVDGLEFLPRMRGSWKLSTSQVASLLRQWVPGQRERLEVGFRLVGGQSYFRMAARKSLFGKDCWANLDTAGNLLSAKTLAGRQYGIPATVNVFLQYRPEGEAGAGTTSLYDALGALGFQRVANSYIKVLRDARVPIEFDLQAGRLYRGLIYPHDIIEALDALATDAPDLAQLKTFLVEKPILFWGIDYSGFGDPVDIRPPKRSKLLNVKDPQARCADAR